MHWPWYAKQHDCTVTTWHLKINDSKTLCKRKLEKESAYPTSLWKFGVHLFFYHSQSAQLQSLYFVGSYTISLFKHLTWHHTCRLDFFVYSNFISNLYCCMILSVMADILWYLWLAFQIQCIAREIFELFIFIKNIKRNSSHKKIVKNNMKRLTLIWNSKLYTNRLICQFVCGLQQQHILVFKIPNNKKKILSVC